jgi:hypothetical protein
MPDWLAFSVDLEPNKDGSLDGIPEAMDWYTSVVPRGTVYTTYRIATERPEVVERLAGDHEIGVHVHPREFGHEDDNLATLPRERQRHLIVETHEAVAEAAGLSTDEITAFRAGRHQAGPNTLAVLNDLGFTLDASINVRYQDHLPNAVTERSAPFRHGSGLVELPTTYAEPPLFSRVGLRAGVGGNITATAHELRSDRRFCSGHLALSWLFESTDGVVSMYMHPYDATGYEGLENDGPEFRRRVRTLLNDIDPSFITASDLSALV